MSQLSDKINSYAIELGYELNESIKVNPAVTGTTQGAGNLVLNAANTGLTFEPTDGPIGGAGSWRTLWSNPSTLNGRFGPPSGRFNPLSADGDYGFGFWFKFGSIPTSFNGFLASYGNSSANGVTVSWNAASKKISMAIAGGLSSTLSNDLINNTNWHYVAIRRETSPAIRYYMYLDGVFQISATGTSVTNAVGPQTYGSSSAQLSGNFFISYSNIHWSTSTILNQTAISEIWTAGSTAPNTSAPVKYYDGSSWITSSAQKVYNGTAWVDWNKKYYNGTSWVQI